MARLRHQQFATVHEVNDAIRPLLERLNARPFQKLSGSRMSTFAELDAPALLPLPAQRYEIAHFKTVRVHVDYHVEVEGHRYSVPHALVGQVLEARITTGAIEMLHRGQRIASHVALMLAEPQLKVATPGAAVSAPSLSICRRRTAHTWNGRRNDSFTGARTSVWPPLSR